LLTKPHLFDYWNIHRRVTRRVLLELSPVLREIIANDATHTTPQYQWFEAKINADALRLYEDADYYDNKVHTIMEDGTSRVVSLWCKQPN
jgi:hypothetical protein